MTDESNDPRIAESLEEQLDHAAEELITGDSDDPPLGQEAVVEMIRMTHLPKASGRDLKAGGITLGFRGLFVGCFTKNLSF